MTSVLPPENVGLRYRKFLRFELVILQPGFTSGGTPYRFVAPGGGVFEYTLENAADNEVSTLEARQQRLAKELLTR